MAWGDGSIIHKGGDAWEIQIPLHKREGRGGTVYPRATATIHGARADAVRKRREMARARDLGSMGTYGRTLFADSARAWAARRTERGELSEAAALELERIARILSGEFGGLRLDELTPARIDEGLTRLQRRRDVGNSTLRRYFTVLSQILKTAREYGYIAANPCERVKAPARDRVERRALDAAEAARLAAALETSGERARAARDDAGACVLAAARLALATGARLGELLAATRADVGGEPPRLRIDKALADSGSVKEPKTRAGRRTVPIDSGAAGALGEWMEYQKGRGEALGRDVGGGTPLFSPDGEHMGKSAFEKRWRRWADTNGFPGLKLHELRHTYATLLLGAGVDVKTVQRLLGHSSAQTTLDHYAHAIPDNLEAAAMTLERVIANGGRLDRRGRD